MKKVWELPPGTGVLGVGSSAGAPLRLSPSTSLGASAKQGRLPRKARGCAHPPVISCQPSKTPTLQFLFKVAHPPGATTLGGRQCPSCGREVSRGELIKSAKVGRVVAQGPKSQEKRSETQRRHRAAQQTWCSSPKPAWLNQDTYLAKIQPRLAGVTISALASALEVSESYAADIRAGRRRPHPRHWQALADLAGISQQD